MPFLGDQFGNPSSIHASGRAARAALEQARIRIAEHLGCTPKEVLFTSGGSEADNWAVFGLAETHQKKGKHIVSTAIEHEAILEPLKQLESRGFDVTYLKPDRDGRIDPRDLEQAVREDTIFVTIIYANNEIGTVQDITALSAIAKERGIPFHTDACQALNYLPVGLDELGVDLITVNSGKIYGPKGAGALIIRDGINITPLLFGGGQEFRMRAGTENVAAIVGFGEATRHIPKDAEKTTTLRDDFIQKLLAIPGVTLNGHPTERLPNNVNISIKGTHHESVLVRLDMEHIAASAGSACSSGSIEPSHVLLALGLGIPQANSSIRFSLGRHTTKQELNQTVDKLTKIIDDLRASQP